MQTRYDVIVVGAGHAGCEAAHAAARLGCRTLLLTIDLDKLAHMSCNPSIGGPAKGHLVREIDAMGGLMGRITDRSAIQIRLLNESKGPAVQSLRAQCDKRLYARLMKETLERVPNLDLRQAMVERIAPPNADTQCFTVTTHTGWRYLAPAVILTTGTFLRGRAITGEAMWGAGRAGEAPAMALSEDLAALGFPLVRLKTGTPPRLAAATIDFSLTELQPGSDKPLAFGHYYAELGETIPPPDYHGPPAPVYPHPQLTGWRPQLPCYQVHTTPEFHAIIRANLHRAPLFSGIIEGVGPRYCPSIEDKIVRFADKERHGLFLEPEGWTTSEVYVQGCNTSLPEDVQWAMLRAIPALRNVELMRIGYAIEYDAVATGEITADMQTRRLRGLFFAGQINGTTGYEEAAAQGLMAGINAAHYVQGKPPVILGRAEAYIGVLIDDLTTKEIREPYRMFTSRAEYRLLLRGDNADLRLTPLAYRLGLVDGERAAVVEARRAQAEQAVQQARERRIFPSAAVNAALEAQGIKPLSQPATVAEVLARPDVRYDQLRAALPELPELSLAVAEQVEIACKYSGYIARQEREVARLQKMENRRIPPDFDYAALPGLRNEARQVLMRFRPATLGQAGRLAGINPADVAIVLFALERQASATPRQSPPPPVLDPPAR
ncbi:tRNA uridine-5-carboxymethylaminomethyl(34) synthesis enzyme MnmG [Chloroflexus sp.]|uniref:tRNA uridine-5-carboxymethylaminomethyl modification enzyme MnmG/GidA n=1 Tax=Chloroflexus sp. TaxID=1904827 RepID=UPI002ACD92D3|nr:tRNA uridine-5-carboxymethylaminomethyl(34) synthesis enzyme MnmG [Chloroflexus sp.]